MKKTTSPETEVEELLRAVQDEMLLGLALDSHHSRLAPDYLPSDLDHRFRALKNPHPPSSSMPPIPPPDSATHAPAPKTAPPAADSELVAVLGGDLAARFAALKTTLPEATPIPAAGWGSNDRESEDEEDEVERLIQWAKDAARLDPSPASDDDDDLDLDEGELRPGK